MSRLNVGTAGAFVSAAETHPPGTNPPGTNPPMITAAHVPVESRIFGLFFSLFLGSRTRWFESPDAARVCPARSRQARLRDRTASVDSASCRYLQNDCRCAPGKAAGRRGQG